MWRFCCPYLFLFSPSFDASRKLCFVIVAIPGYLLLFFFLLCSVACVSACHNTLSTYGIYRIQIRITIYDKSFLIPVLSLC